MAELSKGDVFAGYRIEEIAGRGGMGVVYRAIQIGLDRPVALKLITPELAHDAGFRARFKRESQIAASIDHPNVIPVYEAGEAEDRLFITMRYVDGTDLSALIAREGQLEPEQATRTIGQIGAALDAAHKRGLVHRDVKPANVLIGGDEEGLVYLTDFGLTKHATSVSGLTKTGQFIGTLDYVPPEQIEGKHADARADVYALGCVLYQALTGQRPYERDSDVAKMYAHLSDPPPTVTHVRPDTPPAFDAVIQRAMAKSPAERYPSAGDLARGAQAALDETIAVPRERSVATGMAAPVAAAGAPTAPAEAGATEIAGGQPTAPAEAGPTALGGGPPTAPGEAGPTALGGGPPTAPGEAGPTALGGGPPTAPAGEAPTGEAAPAHRPPSAPTAPIEEKPKPRRRFPVVIALVLGLGVLVAVLAVAGVIGGGGDEGGGEEGGGEASAAASIEVGQGPDGVVVGGGSVWVSNYEDDTVTQIDPASNEAAGRPLAVGKNPDGIVYADDAVWVANTDDGTVSRAEPGGGDPSSVTVGSEPVGLGLGDVNVWVTNSGDDTVMRIDRESEAVTPPPIQVGSRPVGIFVGQESIWVTNSGDGTVTRIGRRTNETLGKPIPVGSTPRAVVEAEGSVWVVNEDDDNVSRIDPSPGRAVGDPVPVGAGPKEIAFGEGYLWVTNEGDSTVTRIDPGTGQVVGDPIEVGSEPRGIAVGEGAVWVANSGDGTISRIEP